MAKEDQEIGAEKRIPKPVSTTEPVYENESICGLNETIKSQRKTIQELEHKLKLIGEDHTKYLITLNSIDDELEDIDIRPFIENYGLKNDGVDLSVPNNILLQKIKLLKATVNTEMKEIREPALNNIRLQYIYDLFLKLSDRIERKEKELFLLRDKYLSLRKKNIDLEALNYQLDEDNSQKESKIVFLKEEIEKTKADLNAQSKEIDRKFVFVVSPKTLKIYECKSPHIVVMGRKAKVLSKHHKEGSYSEENKKRCVIVKINNWENFWVKNYLIIYGNT